MYFNLKKYAALASILIISACVSVPRGPSTMALPGTNKSFDQFRYDDTACRGFAQDQIGGSSANQAADDSFLRSAITGTVIGAALGAAAGGRGDTGAGAVAGLFVGSIMGAEAANISAYSAQRRYDNAYIQCMYAKGHRVPVSGHIEQRPMSRMPAQRYIPPPPPPGYAPPPETQ